MKGKVSRCNSILLVGAWLFCMNKMLYAFFLCKEFRILAFRNAILDQKKWSITGIYRNNLGNIAFGADLNSIMKTALMIQLFDTEVKHRHYCMPLWLQSQSLVGFTSLLKFWGSWVPKIRIIHRETFLCQC